MKGFIGFVHQDDQLFPTLTVWETLMYIAKLRLPRSFTVEQKAAQVERVILALGLSRCRDTLVGDVSIRGISGGERKRVSIAQELLASPSVILLDEPTSGLDSTTALRLIRTLHGLASGGRSIMMTIHQPSHRVYQQLDKLMLLSKVSKDVQMGTITILWWSLLPAACGVVMHGMCLRLSLSPALQFFGSSGRDGVLRTSVCSNQLDGVAWGPQPTWLGHHRLHA